MDKSEVYSNWFNPGIGIELEPNKNTDDRVYTSENGVLFHVYYLLRTKLDPSDTALFRKLLTNLRGIRAGTYNRSLNCNPMKPNTLNFNSKDNMLAIAAGLNLIEDRDNDKKAMLKDCLTHGLSVSNHPVKKQYHHPAFYGEYLALLNCPLYLLFLPFVFINLLFNLVYNKKDDVSGRLLSWMTLNVLKDKFGFKLMHFIFTKTMIRIYGENYLIELMKYYFRHTEHPLRQENL